MTFLAQNKTKLTKEDIKALRKADTVCFRYQQHDAAKGSQLSCIDVSICDKTIKSITIPVDAAIYDHDCKTTDFSSKSKKFSGWLRCFTSIRFAQQSSQIWLTIANNLKEGDRIQLRWDRNNNNEAIERVNMSQDSLTLIVERELNSGKVKRFNYIIDTQVLDRYSPARMCRYTEEWIDRQFVSRCWLNADITA